MTVPTSVAGPESSISVTGRPLVELTTTGNGGVRTVTAPGGEYTIVWAMRAEKWATTERLAFMITVVRGFVPEASPVHPVKVFPAFAVAVTVASELAG